MTPFLKKDELEHLSPIVVWREGRSIQEDERHHVIMGRRLFILLREGKNNVNLTLCFLGEGTLKSDKGNVPRFQKLFS